jgi:hypothetical protein
MKTINSFTSLAVSLLAITSLWQSGLAADQPADEPDQPQVLQPEPASEVAESGDANDGACACQSQAESCDCDACCDAGHAPGFRVAHFASHLGHRAGHIRSSMAGLAHSGQPLVDPWARADWRAAQVAGRQSWHAGYYHTGWGVPVALMVPPTARMQTRWGWGVAQSTMTPIYHQFERPYPGCVTGVERQPGEPVLPTPRWPSHTDQFGVYYVRGPW